MTNNFSQSWKRHRFELIKNRQGLGDKQGGEAGIWLLISAILLTKKLGKFSQVAAEGSGILLQFGFIAAFMVLKRTLGLWQFFLN